MIIISALARGGPRGTCPGCKILGKTFSEKKFDFLDLFFQTHKYFATLNILLYQCLYFSLSIDIFATVKAQKDLLYTFSIAF